MFTITFSEFRLLFKRRINLFVLFVAPALCLLLIGLVLNLGKEKAEWIRIPVVDQDKGEISTHAIRRLSGVEGFVLELTNADNKKFTREQVKGMVERGERQIAIIFPEDFTEQIKDFGTVQAEIVTAQTVSKSQVGPIKGSVSLILDSVARNYLLKKSEPSPAISHAPSPASSQKTSPNHTPTEDPGMKDDTAARVSIKTELLSQALMLPNAAQHTVMGFIVLWTFCISFYLMGSVNREKVSGMWNRIKASPVPGLMYIAGLSLPYFLCVLGQIVVLFFVGLLFITIQPSSIPGILVLSFALACAATAYGMFAASWPGNHARKLWANLAIMILMGTLGGCIIPIHQMGSAFQSFAHIFPHSWAMESLARCLLYDGTFSPVIVPSVILLGYAVLFIGLAYARLDL